MAKSYVEYTANGSTNQFNLTFNYIDQSHVHVFFGDTTEVGFTWVNASLVQTTTVPPVGTVVRVRRLTPTTPLTVYPPTSTLLGSDLTRALLQALYCDEENELSDSVLLAKSYAAQAAASAAGIGATATIISTLAGLAAAPTTPALGLLNAPPVSPANNDIYLIGNAPTGAWAGQGGKVARYVSASSSWSFQTVQPGTKVLNRADVKDYIYQNGRWNKVMFTQAGATYQDFSDIPDGTLITSLTVSADGSPYSIQGAGSATAVISGGQVHSTGTGTAGNMYNVLAVRSPDFYVTGVFKWGATPDAEATLAFGKYPIITKMVHCDMPLGGAPTITLWGASFVSTFMGVPQPNILENDIPGGVTLLESGVARPAAGEKFRLSALVIGESCWVMLHNKDDNFVLAKSFKWVELPTLVGEYAYFQSQSSATANILNVGSYPIGKEDFPGLLPTIYPQPDVNAPITFTKTLTSGTSTPVFKIPMSATITNFAYEIDVSLNATDTIPQFAGELSRWKTAGGYYSGAPATSGPTKCSGTGETAQYSFGSGTAAIAATGWTTAWDGTYLTFSFTGTKTGSDASTTQIASRFTLRKLSNASPTPTAL